MGFLEHLASLFRKKHITLPDAAVENGLLVALGVGLQPACPWRVDDLCSPAVEQDVVMRVWLSCLCRLDYGAPGSDVADPTGVGRWVTHPVAKSSSHDDDDDDDDDEHSIRGPLDCDPVGSGFGDCIQDILAQGHHGLK